MLAVLSFIAYLSTNSEAIITTLMGLQVLATIVVNLTPTPVDNEIVSKIYKAVEAAAGILTKKAKQ